MLARLWIVSLMMVGVLASSSAMASEFDQAMSPILAEYLKIQAALAADGTEGVPSAAKEIRQKAASLDAAQAPEAHRDHFKGLRGKLEGACARMEAAEGIGDTREAFKDLSKPVAMWVQMSGPRKARVMFCPMANASWVQEGSEVANPYYGSSMLNCGEEVGRGIR